MKKIRNVSKRMLAAILSLLMIMSVIPITVLGATENLGKVSGGSDIDIDVSWHYGHQLHTTTVSGTTYPMFCIEYGTTSPKTAYLQARKAGANANVIEAAKWIFAGYYMVHGNSVSWKDMAMCQKKVWEVLGDSTSWDFSNADYDAWCDAAEKMMENLDTKPSFDKTNIGTIRAGTSKTVTDSNKVLKNYPAFTTTNKGVQISHDAKSNKLTITIDKTCTETSFKINNGDYYKNYTGEDDELLLFYPYGSKDYQKIVYSAYYDPISFALDGDIEVLGSAKLKKTSEDGKVSGIKFTVTGKNYSNTVKTDSNGEWELNYLVPGKYTVTEEVDSRYQEQKSKSVTVTSGATATVTFNNVLRKGNAHLKKTSEDGKVSGIAFTVTGDNYSKTVKTNANGEWTLKNLVPGKYTVTETAISRYEPQKSQTITVKADETTEVRFNNVLKKGSVHLKKTSEDGKVSGIKFTVTGTDYSKTVKTDENGEWQIDNLLPGKYTVTEEALSRYKPQASKTITVKASGVTEVTFKNVLRRGSAKLKKVSEDGVVSGIKFTVTGDNYKKTVKTDDKGEWRLENLLPGKYTITEQSISRYKPQESKTVTVKVDETVEVTFNNLLRRGSAKIVKTSEDGIVANIKFHIKGAEIDKDIITNAKGEFQVDNLLPGKYTVTEYEIDRYEPVKAQTVTVVADTVSSVTFTNVLKRGDLQVTKTCEDGLVEGIEFHLSGTSLSGAKINEYATTNASGVATFKNILIGTGYTVEEVDTAIRYVIPDSQTTSIKWNEVTKASFTNKLKKFRVTVTKEDAEKKKAQGDATLAGATYGIYDNGKLIDTYVTDENASFTTKYYICGDHWSIREIKPSEGYLLNDTEYHVGAEAKLYKVEFNDTANTVTEPVIKGNMSIIKHSDDGSTQIETPEPEAEFQVYLKSAGSYAKADKDERDILDCDNDGFAQSKDLPYGVYTVHQTKGVEGSDFMQDFDVYIAKNGKTYKYLINNAPFKAYLKITKVDRETGKVVPYAGAGFEIYDSNGKKVLQTFTYPKKTTISTYYTNADGYLITPEKLDYGKNYTLVEVQAPYGYVLDSTPIKFNVTRENSEIEDALTLIKVKRDNIAQKGIIEVTKSGEVFASVENTDNIYTPVYEVQNLKGAVYQVFAAENIKTPDGTIRYQQGEQVDEITTGNDGIAKTKQLYLGKYTVVEKTAPVNFVNANQQYDVELVYAGQNIAVTSTALSVYNERQKVTTSLSKVMQTDETYKLGMNDEILSVQFGIYAAEDVQATDGSVIPADDLITIANCDKDGNITFDCDLPIGFKWYAKEIATDEHYILSEEQHFFDTEYAGQETAVIDIKLNDGEPIANNLIYGKVTGYKIDRETEKPIKDVVFGIFKGDETGYTEKTAITTATTDENGVFEFNNVPFGAWIIRELTPAENYLENTDLHHFDIERNEKVIDMNIVNDRVPELKTTAAIDGEKTVCATETFTLTDTVEYQHLIPGKEYKVVGVLMDKSTGKELVINGDTFKSEVTFTPEAPSGSVDVLFTFDGKNITTETNIVVFESLYKDGKELAVHADINDEGQTVTVKVPEIKTSAKADGKSEVEASKKITIVDTVTYKNLTVGKEYVIKGVLMDKRTKEPFIVNGMAVTADTVFTPQQTNEKVEVTFIFDGSGLTKQTQTVVFESLLRNDIEIAAHADINDAEQTVTVRIPEIKTKAAINKKKTVFATQRFTITDTVIYRNLIPGESYTVKGILMDKSTGKPLRIDGETITSEKNFVASKGFGTVDILFSFDSTKLKTDTDMVVFETLYKNITTLATHADINDKGQTVTVRVPEIRTTAEVDGGNRIEAANKICIVDTVQYRNLTVGKKYTVCGVLMNKATGNPFTVNGKKIVSKATFTPKTSSGTVSVSFTFDGSKISAETSLVVFETLYYKNRELAAHADINDKNQTITVVIPEIETSADIQGQKSVCATELFELTDTVKYHNLVSGKKYTIKGILINKATGKALMLDGRKVTAGISFTPEQSSGSINISFKLDTRLIKSDTDIVVFEYLYRNGKELAVHADINDEGQTVTVKVPEIKTSAKADGKSEVEASKIITIVDTVIYKNLTVGKEYVISGELMDKATGKPFLINEQPIRAEVKFTPDKSDGTVEVTFVFDGSGITAETEVVVFERIYRDEVEIATHTDINDKGQTIKITVPEKTTTTIIKKTPKTGDDTDNTLWWILAAICAAGAGVVGVTLFRSKKKKEETDDDSE